MTSIHRLTIAIAAVAAMISPALADEGCCDDKAVAWSSRPGRNAAAPCKNLPTELTDANKIWEFSFGGGAQFTIPTTNGEVLLTGGVQRMLPDRTLSRLNRAQGAGSLVCLDPKTGKLIWQMLLAGVGENAAFYGAYGTCSTPVIDGDEVYIVDPSGHLLCLDIDGQADGNDGPFTDELAYMTNADLIPIRRGKGGGDKIEAPEQLQADWGDILWKYEFLESEQVAWKHCFSGTMVIDGDLIYLPTSNSQHCLVKQGGQPFNAGYSGKGGPEGHPVGHGRPGMLVVDKRTGTLVARACSDVPRVYHGQWSSPSMGAVDGRKLVFFADGYGIVHAYATLDADKLPDEVTTLEEVWRFDAVPEAMRKARYGKLTYTNRRGTAEAPRADQPLQANIIAAPVFHDGKVYVGLGRDHNYGIAPGVLWCIDASRTGELDESAAVWKVDQEIKTTMCAVAIADGLCYYVDSAGQLFCFDAETGRKYWKHDLGAGVYYGEPLVADGKVFVTTEKDHVVLKAGKETEELFRTNARGAEGRTMACLDGILFVPTNRQLAAYGASRAQ